MKLLATTILVFLIPFSIQAQQLADHEYRPSVKNPHYAVGKGPIIAIDEAHHNFHTREGRYNAFTKVLTADGYRVVSSKNKITADYLATINILVIANAIHPENDTLWALPTKSAFTTEEISVLEKWVHEGGSLFLIADHMPMPGAVHALAQQFGYTFYNGFATDTTQGIYPGQKRELDLFSRKKNTLGKHAITQNIEQIATFTGQAFEIPTGATSLLTFDERFKILLPDTAWKFHKRTPRMPINGFSQGAVSTYGKGRLAVFGEAAMFTAQTKGASKVPFGFNAPDAPENIIFLRNIIQWLNHTL
jgi:hypothetical protein